MTLCLIIFLFKNMFCFSNWWFKPIEIQLKLALKKDGLLAQWWPEGKFPFRQGWLSSLVISVKDLDFLSLSTCAVIMWLFAIFMLCIHTCPTPPHKVQAFPLDGCLGRSNFGLYILFTFFGWRKGTRLSFVIHGRIEKLISLSQLGSAVVHP